MTPKEKAEELIAKYYKFDVIRAKDYAIIGVDEIIEVLWKTNLNETEYRYWLDVKKEIENL
jgi:hypothetical protein